MVGLFELGCLVNHSCKPNLLHSFDASGGSKSQSLSFTALASVTANEPVSFSYVKNFEELAVTTRRRALNVSWGFWCNCPKCHDEPLSLTLMQISNHHATEAKQDSLGYELLNEAYFLRYAAEEGNADAQHYVGEELLKNGCPLEAFAWQEKSAKQGFPAAQHRLFLMLRDGPDALPGCDAVLKDDIKAREWLAKAAKRDLPAMKDYGMELFVSGRMLEGLRYLVQSAEGGLKDPEVLGILQLLRAGDDAEMKSIIVASTITW